jgi:HSP20 family protein
LFDADWDVPEEIGKGLNVYETKDDVVVEACVPGVDPKDVEVEVEGDLISVRGEAKVEEEDEKKKTYYRKMEERSFDYVTTAPRPVMGNKAKAEVKDGVVTVTVPKAEEAKPKTVKVEVK